MSKEEQSTYPATLPQNALPMLVTIGAFCYIFPSIISKVLNYNLKIMTDLHSSAGISGFIEPLSRQLKNYKPRKHT